MKTRESAIRAELERLALQHGGDLQPDVVVNAARSETSPLHNSFDWDDTEAAEKWRLHQARNLIRVMVTFEVVPGSDVRVHTFTSLSSDRHKGGRGYRMTVDVLSDADLRQELLSDARAEMRRFKYRYQALCELAEVFAAIDNTERRFEVAAEQVVQCG